MKQHTFKDAYGTLQQHAQTLRDQTEPNIDDLLQIVEESVAAYKTCQSRIDAVEKALEKALSSTETSAATASPASRATTSTPPVDDDKDIPF